MIEILMGAAAGAVGGVVGCTTANMLDDLHRKTGKTLYKCDGNGVLHLVRSGSGDQGMKVIDCPKMCAEEAR